MPQDKLTDVVVRKAMPQDKPKRLFDGGGLYLEVSPAGGQLWRLKYRIDGKEKRLALGIYPDTRLADARSKRDAARKLLAQGIDPGEQRKAAKASGEDTFEAIGREWYARHAPAWAPAHRDRIIRRLERDIFPRIGSLPIRDITAPVVLEVLRRIERRGAMEAAHRAMQNCGRAFRYAVAAGRAERDPTSDPRGALPPVKQAHHPSIADPSGIGELLRAIDGHQGSEVTRCALRLSSIRRDW